MSNQQNSIEVHSTPTHLFVRCQATLIDEKEAKECLEKLVREDISHRSIIFDFKAAQDISVGAMRILTKASTLLTEPNSGVRVVCGADVGLRIKDQGLDRLLQCFGSEEDALGKKAAAPASTADTMEFLNTVLTAIAHTLKVMAQTEVAAGKGYLRDKGPAPITIDVAAVIGIVSIPFNGLLVLAFPSETYLKVMSRMFGQKFDKLEDEIRDGAAELLNIILGQVKIPLNEKGYEIKQAIPSVVHGQSVQIFPSTLKPSIIVPYESDAGAFYIELTTNRTLGKI